MFCEQQEVVYMTLVRVKLNTKNINGQIYHHQCPQLVIRPQSHKKTDQKPTTMKKQIPDGYDINYIIYTLSEAFIT